MKPSLTTVFLLLLLSLELASPLLSAPYRRMLEGMIPDPPSPARVLKQGVDAEVQQARAQANELAGR